jgi:hypothetical protein
MSTKILIIAILAAPSFLFGQTIIKSAPFYPTVNKPIENVEVMHHYISINPLNICLFQQIGVTYEYRPGKFGYGITPGYIYPNIQEYSNWFIAGPTNAGSLGWYSGWFVVPQVNLYLTRQKETDEGGVLYIAVKFVYKHMRIDTTSVTVWHYDGDSYGTYRKMFDNVNIYGGFLDLGYRYFLGHFFIDLNFGLGSMWLNHNMNIYAEGSGTSPNNMHYLTPPAVEKYHQWAFTVNFTLNLGAAF